MNLKYEKVTSELIKTFYDVYNELGWGFLETVYQNSMFIELKSRGFDVVAQKQIKVKYKGIEVGSYYADLIIDDMIIIELKSAERLIAAHEAQLLNYLKGTDIEVGLLFNFGKKPEIRRQIYELARK